jgi:hypothetical protein
MDRQEPEFNPVLTETDPEVFTGCQDSGHLLKHALKRILERFFPEELL